MKCVAIAGEGSNDIGDFAKQSVYWTSPQSAGVLGAILAKVRPSDSKIVHGTKWKDVRKYTTRKAPHTAAETKSVLGLANDADERGIPILVFIRDADKIEGRAEDLEIGIARARELFAVKIAGGVPVRRVESWVLATFDVSRSELLGNDRVDDELNARGIRKKSTDSMMTQIEAANLHALPADAHSFAKFIAALGAAFQ